MTISRKDVEHVAHLARLGLSDEEITLLTRQLDSILENMQVYRARFGGDHKLMIEADLRRGATVQE